MVKNVTKRPFLGKAFFFMCAPKLILQRTGKKKRFKVVLVGVDKSAVSQQTFFSLFHCLPPVVTIEYFQGDTVTYIDTYNLLCFNEVWQQ